jgi:hypothetical protein
METTAPKTSRSLAAKLAEVVLSVSHVEKRGRNDFHKYDYATEADVLEAVRRGLAERSVVIVPRCVGSAILERGREGKAPMFVTTADMVLTLVDGESGEVMECQWKGSGEDSGDKGLYKALTGGYKYFLLKLFMIPTGDDPEKDTKKRKGQAPPADAPPPAPEVASDISIIQTIAVELGKLTGQHPEDVIKAFSSFPGKDGKEMSFTDPRHVKSAKWLKGVREKLEREMQRAGAKDAIGSEEPPF